MALRLAGEEMGVHEKIETIDYYPGLQDTGDLEAGTKTITATAEASGVENADYNAALTLPKPSDARLVVARICARLAVTIDSMTAGTLYVRVYVDAQDADHRLIDGNWTSTGAKNTAVDTHSDAHATIFNLLKDGSAHTFYFFFWVDAGNAVISLVQLWEGVGSCSTDRNIDCLDITFEGFVAVMARITRQGSGTPAFYFKAFVDATDGGWRYVYTVSGAPIEASLPSVVVKNPRIAAIGTVTTDLNHLSNLLMVLRRVQ